MPRSNHMRLWAGLSAGLLVGTGLYADEPLKPTGAVPPLEIPLADSKPTPATEPYGKVVPGKRTASPEESLARLFADTKTALAKVRDYSGHYVRHEQVEGRLIPEQTCEIRVRTKPFSISVKVISPSDYSGRETVYISDRYNGKVRLKEAKKLSYKTLEQDDPAVLADTRHKITNVGLAAIVERLERSVSVERRLNNPVEVLVSDYLFQDRQCTRYEIITPRPHAYRYAYRQVVYIDKEKKLPLRYESYAQPKPGGKPTGEMIEMQSFVGLRFNLGLGESAFVR